MPCLSVGHNRGAIPGTGAAMLAAPDGEGAVGPTSTTWPHGPLPTADGLNLFVTPLSRG